MKRQQLFDNTDVRRLLTVYVSASLLFLLFAVLSFAAGSVRIQNHLYTRESSVAGYLISHPASTVQGITGAFTARPAENDTLTGKQAFGGAGYSAQTADSLMPFVKSDVIWIAGIVSCAFLVCFGLSGLFIYLSFRSIYRHLDLLSAGALSISRGEYSLKLKEDSEGAFARLNHAFNEMTSGINSGFEKLRRERIFLKNLISDISHQLKTPLAALKMYNEIIAQEEISPAAKDFTSKSGEQLERMEWLILGLLKMARIEAGCLELEMRRENVMEITHAALRSFELAAHGKHLSLSLNGDSSTELNCDAGWLEEAIGNIIKNCLEYTPDGGHIHAEVWQTPVMVSIRISDTGVEIHPDELPYIFRRFYRGNRSPGTGSGIGLSLSKSITEQMGGTLTAGGKYGQGAVFTFSFLKDVI